MIEMIIFQIFTSFASPGHIYLWAAYNVVRAVITEGRSMLSLYKYLQKYKKEALSSGSLILYVIVCDTFYKQNWLFLKICVR